MLAILHALPDSDDPYAIAARLMDAVPSGSYLVISHGGSDRVGQEAQQSSPHPFRMMGFAVMPPGCHSPGGT